LLLLPAFILYVINLVNKKIFAGPDLLIMSGALLSTIPIALVIFMIMGTGWAQFGARYTLDFQLFLLIFLCFAYKRINKIMAFRVLAAFLICLSCIINYLGVLVFFWEY
jgi:hypothetical protein